MVKPASVGLEDAERARRAKSPKRDAGASVGPNRDRGLRKRGHAVGRCLIAADYLAALLLVTHGLRTPRPNLAPHDQLVQPHDLSTPRFPRMGGVVAALE